MAENSMSPRRQGLREWVVPAIMLVVIGFYAYASAQLSGAALIFPGVLMLVILAAIAWPLAATFSRRGPAQAADGDDEAGGPILALRAWALVVLPVVLFALFQFLGALTALVALVFGAQLFFSTRAPALAFLIALITTIPVYALFKYFLYVRFPLGVLGIG